MACPGEQPAPALLPLDALIFDTMALHPGFTIGQVCDWIADNSGYTARSIRNRASWLRLFEQEREASQ